VSPIGVPGPIRVKRSFSLRASIALLPSASLPTLGAAGGLVKLASARLSISGLGSEIAAAKKIVNFLSGVLY
jgi:hypothetical protein